VKKAVKSSSFKGTSWDTRVNKWKAQISISHKAIHLGYFETEEEAGRKFDEAAAPLGRPLNFPGEAVVEVVGSRGGDGCWSKYKGVRWNGKTGQWVVKIKMADNGKFESLGSFEGEEEAARVYDASAAPLGMLLNFPPPAEPKKPKAPKVPKEPKALKEPRLPEEPTEPKEPKEHTELQGKVDSGKRSSTATTTTTVTNDEEKEQKKIRHI
jgi:hypothetical protein